MTLSQIVRCLWARRLVAAFLTFACGAAACGASLLIPDRYTATTTLYVIVATGQADEAGTWSVLTSGQMVANDVAAMLGSARARQLAAQEAGLPSAEALDVRVRSSARTRLVTVAVTCTDPSEAASAANALATHASELATGVIGTGDVRVLERAEPAESPSGPSHALYALMGAVAGFILGAGAAVAIDQADTRMRAGAQVEEVLGIPVVGSFNDVSHDRWRGVRRGRRL